MKIGLKETLVDLRKKLAINDYGGFRNKAAEKGARKLDFQLGVNTRSLILRSFRMAGCSSPNQILTKPVALSVSLQSDWDNHKVKF